MAENVPALRVRGLHKAFGATQALSPLDLDIPAGQIHALLGENGSGKSTLIKILAGYHRADGGEVEIAGQPLAPGSAAAAHALGARFVHQDLGLVATESVLDNLCAGVGYLTRFGTIHERKARAAAREDLARVGLDIDPRRTVSSLTSVEQTGVAIARALRTDPHAAPQLLVLDEPTARLPEREVAHLLTTIRSAAAGGIAVIYVSHRLEEVFTVAEVVTVLRDGKHVATSRVADTTRPALVDLLVGDADIQAPTATPVAQPAAPRTVLAVSDVQTELLRGTSFTVAAGEVLGIAGITGSGRESILPAVFGAVDRHRGQIRIHDVTVRPHRPDLSVAAGIAYLPPDRKLAGGVMDASARENLTLADVTPHWRWPRIRLGDERTETASWFRRLSVRPSDSELSLGSFSGGNQQKVLFAKWLRLTPAVLLLDEPTQGVDIAAKSVLHAEIRAAAAGGTAVVVASTDAEELVAISDRILVLHDGAIAAELSGPSTTVAALSRAALAAQGTAA